MCCPTTSLHAGFALLMLPITMIRSRRIDVIWTNLLHIPTCESENAINFDMSAFPLIVIMQTSVIS